MTTIKQSKNILSTGNVFTTIDLEGAPTTLITGTNGSGKSTLLDAIVFGLYGKPFRKINKAQLINWGYALTDAAMRSYVLEADPGPGQWPMPAHPLK